MDYLSCYNNSCKLILLILFSIVLINFIFRNNNESFDNTLAFKSKMVKKNIMIL